VSVGQTNVIRKLRDTSLGIIALVPDAWDDVVMPRHQVIKRLAGRFPVVWVEPPAYWREYLNPFQPTFLAHDRWSEPAPGLSVIRPGWRHAKFYRPRWLCRMALRSLLTEARRQLVNRGATRIALYLWRDEFADALDLVEHDFSCYHVDDEYTFSELESPIPGRELTLLRRVDQVIVHSCALMQKKGHVNPRTTMVTNGVDYHHFSKARIEPCDLAGIPHPRVGYAGVIKKQMDLGLLARLARARPHYSFVLVGPVMNVAGKECDIEALRQMPNVHWTGGKPAEDLPCYMQHFDVCVMCYEVNDYTRYIYPLKLNEYLASGRPTVSAAIDAVRQYDDVVMIARTDAEWLQAIDRGLTQELQTETATQARRTVAYAHDWDVLVARIIDVFAAASASPRATATAGNPSA
jgi:glycosyltransferase involved in cell wall biosynthesis